MLIPSSKRRTQYVIKHSYQFKHVGEKLFWQPRQFPADPECIYIGNNVKVSSNVVFVNHDIAHKVLNDKFNTNDFKPKGGCIFVGDNVMIGSGEKKSPMRLLQRER